MHRPCRSFTIPLKLLTNILQDIRFVFDDHFELGIVASSFKHRLMSMFFVRFSTLSCLQQSKKWGKSRILNFPTIISRTSNGVSSSRHLPGIGTLGLCSFRLWTRLGAMFGFVWTETIYINKFVRFCLCEDNCVG